MLNALVAMDLPGPGTVFMSQSLRYLAPTYLGDTLTAEVEVLAVKPDKPVCQLEATITNQDGTAVLEGECWTYTLRPKYSGSRGPGRHRHDPSHRPRGSDDAPSRSLHRLLHARARDDARDVVTKAASPSGSAIEDQPPRSRPEFEPKAAQPTPGGLDVCFIASLPLDEVIRRLRPRARRSARPGAEDRRDRPDRSVYVRDPDGNLIDRRAGRRRGPV